LPTLKEHREQRKSETEELILKLNISRIQFTRNHGIRCLGSFLVGPPVNYYGFAEFWKVPDRTYLIRFVLKLPSDMEGRAVW